MKDLVGPFAFPLFRRLSIAANLSHFSFTVLGVAAAYLVFQMTRSAVDVGVLAALAIVPGIVGPAVTATMMERYCPRKMAINLAVVKTAAPAMMAILYALGDLTVGWIFVLVFIGGLARAGIQPIILELYRYTLPPEHRDDSTATHRHFVEHAVTLIGAVTSAIVYTHFGAEVVFSLAALASLMMLIVLRVADSLQASCDALRLRPPPPPLLEGLRSGLSIPIVAAALISGGFLLLLVAPLQSLAPRIAMSHGESPMYVGWLVAALAAGGMAASLISERFANSEAGQRRELELALVLVGPLLALLGISMSLATDLLVLFLLGASLQITFVVMPWAVLTNAPKEISGRMVGLLFVVGALTGGLGALIMGALVDRFGLEEVLIVCGTVALIFGAFRAFRISRSALVSTSDQ
ncbi:MAG: MFS transporter [Solirubrobacterales bacterium]